MTVDQLRARLEARIAEAQALESKIAEAEQKERVEAEIAARSQAIRDRYANAVDAIAKEEPIPDGWRLSLEIRGDRMVTLELVEIKGKRASTTATSSGNGGHGSAGGVHARPKLEVPEGKSLFVVLDDGNIAGPVTLDDACDRLGLAHYCKSGAMTRKGDSPSRVLLEYQEQHPERIVYR